MSQFSLLLVPISCLSVLVWLIWWTHKTSHDSWILLCRSYGWRNVVGYNFVLLLIWVWWLLIIGNCFAMGWGWTIMTSLLASVNSWNEARLIDSVILSKKTQGIRRIAYPPLMKLIKMALGISFRASTIPVFFSSQSRYQNYIGDHDCYLYYYWYWPYGFEGSWKGGREV